MLTYTLKVVALHRECNDAITICFKQPGLKKVNYKAGQYLTVIVNINNRKYKRPYSLSSSPNIDRTLNITVKRISNGIVSNHLIDIVKEGDILEVMEPMGDFIYQTDINYGKEIFLWGAGSGITPLMAIAKTALNANSCKVNLFYCNKSQADTIFSEQLLTLKNFYGERFSLNLFYTQEPVLGATPARINAEDVNKAVQNCSDIENSVHYICGPLGLKTLIKEILIEQGLTNSQILSEDFEHIINKSELNDVKTAFVEIKLKDEKFNIEVIKGNSILEAGLDYQIDLPYSCQTGSCTLCKATLVEGEVKKIGDVKIDGELKDNERLLCCSYPLTDNVKFKLD